MVSSGMGALGVWHGVAEGREAEIEHWYNVEHHGDRVVLDGFHRARRYRNLGEGPTFFSRYDVEDVAVLAGEEYQTALANPTPWASRIFPHYRDTVRGTFSVVERRGRGMGGVLLSVRLPSAGPVDAARPAAASALGGINGVVNVEVWVIDEAIAAIKSKEKEIRGKPDSYPAAALLVDATSPEAAFAARAALPNAILDGAAVDVMRLVFQLTKADLAG